LLNSTLNIDASKKQLAFAAFNSSTTIGDIHINSAIGNGNCEWSVIASYGRYAALARHLATGAPEISTGSFIATSWAGIYSKQ
jgi:hypothetical protein